MRFRAVSRTRPTTDGPRRLLADAGRSAVIALVGLALISFATPRAPLSAATTALPAGHWETIANGDDVLAMKVDGNILWAGTRAGGLVKWDLVKGEYSQFLRPQDPLGDNTIHDIDIGTFGRKWLATERGLTVFDDNDTADKADDVWVTYDRANTFGGLGSDIVQAIATQGNYVWVGTAQERDPATGEWSGGGLSRLDTKGTKTTSDDQWSTIITFANTFKKTPTGELILGLPSDNINDILVTPKGNLWVATSPFYRFEKIDQEQEERWQKAYGGIGYLDTKGSPQLTDDSWSTTDCQKAMFTIVCDMQRLAIDKDDWVWATLRGRGVMYFKADEPVIVDEVSRRFNLPESVTGDTVESIAFGPPDSATLANTVWLGRSRGGLTVLNHNNTLRNTEDDEWNFGKQGSFTPADGLPAWRVQTMAFYGNTALIGTGAYMGPYGPFGVAGGVGRLDASISLSFSPPLKTAKTLPTNFVTGLAVGQPGTRWAGHVWVTTGSRAQRRFGQGVLDMNTKGTLDRGDDVLTSYTTLGTDKDGKPPWTGLSGDNVHAVTLQGDRAWFGSIESTWNDTARRYSDGGLAVFDGDSWTARSLQPTATPSGPATPVPTGPTLRDNSVSSIAVGCNGEIWVGTGNPWDAAGLGADVLTLGSSVHRPEQDSWVGYNYPAQLASNYTTGISIDCQTPRVWVAAKHSVDPATQSLRGGGVAVQIPGPTPSWTKYVAKDGIESFAHDSAGNKIAAEVTAILTAANGAVWVGTYGVRSMETSDLYNQQPFWPAVVNHWDGSKWTNRQFPFSGWISALAEDKGGRLFAATSRGGTARESATPEVWRVDHNLGGLFVLEGTTWTTLTVASGLPANDISSLAIGPNGDLWVGTEGWGIGHYAVGAAVPTPTPTLGNVQPTATLTPAATSTDEATPTPVDSPTPTKTLTPTRPPTPTRNPNGGLIYLPYTNQVKAGTVPTATRRPGAATSTPRPGATRTPTAVRIATPGGPTRTRTPGGPTPTALEATPTLLPGVTPTTARPTATGDPSARQRIYTPYIAKTVRVGRR